MARRRVVISIFVGALQIAAPLATSVHMARVVHVACPDDGEFVHATPSRARSTSSPHRAISPDDRSGHHHRHDHCPFALLHHSVASTHVGPAALAPDRWSEPCPHAGSPCAHSIALLHIAPKTSPPDAA